jgi:iron complex transport system substrate-binding protein
MTSCVAATALSVSLTASATQRVASLNLCTDSMLMELATDDQIAAVTTLSRDPMLSPFSQRARHLPTVQGYAEEIVFYQPDLTLSGLGSTLTTNALLTQLGYSVEQFEAASDLAIFEDNFRRVGRLIGAESRANALLSTMHRRLAARKHRTTQLTALILEPNGYVPGAETLADELLAAAGITNQAAALGLAKGGFVTLEALVRSPPTWIFVSVIDASRPALANEFLQHPVLHQALKARMQIFAIPESLWACGGTYFADAVELISQAIQSAPRQ